MEQTTRDILINRGQGNLVYAHDIMISGYGGISSTGQIVDRRLFPHAISFKENPMLNTPKPEELGHIGLTNRDDYNDWFKEHETHNLRYELDDTKLLLRLTCIDCQTSFKLEWDGKEG